MGSKKWILGGVVLFAVLLITAVALVLLGMQSGKAIREEIAHADVGYTVTFGDAEWLVAGIEGDRTLLVREHCLAPMPFDETNPAATWEDCTLRKWLNSDYYKSAFSSAERKLIGQEGVFLLSEEEVSAYFYIYKLNWSSCIARDDNGERVEWWLRSPSEDGLVRFIDPSGSMYDFGISPQLVCSVRPAVWVEVPREERTYVEGARLHYIPWRDFIEPADDESDYKWKIDYQEDPSENCIYINDCAMYEEVFGFAKPTEEELCETIDGNADVPERYRTFLKGFVHDWLAMYPDSDLSVLKHNFKTLHIFEFSSDRADFFYELSGGAVASYFPSNNCIYICEDAELEDKQSEDYIVAVHETIHAARNAFIEKEDGGLVCVTFSEIPENTIGYANYQDEALVSWFACQLQNEGKPSQSYAYLSSMYRQFMPYLDYDGADYINHSAGCFIEALQKEFDACGVGYNALSVFNLLDALMRSHEDGAIPVECSDYAALFDALSQIRQHHIGYEQMDAAAREAAFAEFWADLMLFIDPETTRFPEITEDSYRPYWN